VDITVGANDRVTFSPDPVVVHNVNTLIVFRLKTAAWAFAERDAIVISGPGNQFPYSSWTEQPDRAAIVDLATDHNEYKYAVNLVHKSTGRTLSVDPIIKNNGN
jgi:hypothetical protein